MYFIYENIYLYTLTSLNSISFIFLHTKNTYQLSLKWLVGQIIFFHVFLITAMIWAATSENLLCNKCKAKKSYSEFLKCSSQILDQWCAKILASYLIKLALIFARWQRKDQIGKNVGTKKKILVQPLWLIFHVKPTLLIILYFPMNCVVYTRISACRGQILMGCSWMIFQVMQTLFITMISISQTTVLYQTISSR